MKLVVLGPTGGTGGQVVRHALATGHEVVAIARRPDAVQPTHPNLRVVAGDVLEPATLAGALDGADAVISALGPRAGRAPTVLYSHGIANVRAEMVRAGVRRLVVVSAVPVAPTGQEGVLDRFVVLPLLHLLLGGNYADLRRMEDDLRAADDVDWTVFRPPRLLDGPATGRIRSAVDVHLPRARDIRRSDLARALVSGAGDPALVGHAVTVAA